MNIKKYRGTIGAFILVAIMVSLLLLPWIEVKSEASAVVGAERMLLWLYTNAFGDGQLIKFYVHKNGTQEKFIAHVKANMVIYLSLMMLGIFFYILAGIARIPHIRSKFEKNKILSKLCKYSIFVLLGGVFTLIGSTLFINDYPLIELTVQNETLSTSDMIIILIKDGTNFTEKYTIGGYFSTGPGLGAILSWIIAFFVVIGWVYWFSSKLEFRTSWKLALICSVINIITSTLTIGIMINGDTSILTFPNYLAPEMILELFVSILIVLVIFSLMFTYGKYAITRIEFLSLYLPPDEYRRRLKISTRYWFLSQNVGKILLIAFIFFIIGLMFLTRTMMIVYDALKTINESTYGYTFSALLHIASLASQISFIILWMSPILYFISLGIRRE